MLSLAVRLQCVCYLSLQWSYQISVACHTLRHFYILFLTSICSKCKLAQCVGFLYLKAGCHAIFFLFFLPLRCVLYIFFHQDVYRCFPFITFLNINAPIIIIRKPTLFLCSFHSNDNKCFVHYFWKLKKEKYLHTPPPWHSWNLSHYYFTMFHICRTIQRHFCLRQVKLCIGQWKCKQKSTTQGRKRWLTDWVNDQASEFTLAHLAPISHSAK